MPSSEVPPWLRGVAAGGLLGKFPVAPKLPRLRLGLPTSPFGSVGLRPFPSVTQTDPMRMPRVGSVRNATLLPGRVPAGSGRMWRSLAAGRMAVRQSRHAIACGRTSPAHRLWENIVCGRIRLPQTMFGNARTWAARPWRARASRRRSCCSAPGPPCTSPRSCACTSGRRSGPRTFP